MSSRTSIQRRANEIDMDLYRLAHRIDALADDVPNPVHMPGMRLLVGDILKRRHSVRSLMHPDDVKDTGG